MKSIEELKLIGKNVTLFDTRSFEYGLLASGSAYFAPCDTKENHRAIFVYVHKMDKYTEYTNIYSGGIGIRKFSFFQYARWRYRISIWRLDTRILFAVISRFL